MPRDRIADLIPVMYLCSMTSVLQFRESFPDLDPRTSLVIYDRRLLKVSLAFRRWIKAYTHRYGVDSGEKLKSLEFFPEHARKLAQCAENLSPRTMKVIAVGGGTVGDFAGFFASIYKRGVGLIHVPSTWLAALDSSHGGKTALNSSGAKNQLGTFYPAERVVLIRPLLRSLPENRVRDAMGELAKIALIDGGAWSLKLRRTRRADGDVLWTFLRPAIQAKMRVVRRDPREQTGHRQILNLGHTIGHVLEILKSQSHGEAVAEGLYFAIDFSVEMGRLKVAEAGRARDLLRTLGLKRAGGRKFSAPRFRRLLVADKKKTSPEHVIFIALKGFGKVERVSVSVTDLIDEARRQGLVR